MFKPENVLALSALSVRMEEQERAIPEGLFAYTRNGLRMAIAAIDDEANELYDEWTQHKRALGNCVSEVRHELLDIAAVAMIAYKETFTGEDNA